jgi:hypothetical protein
LRLEQIVLLTVVTYFPAVMNEVPAYGNQLLQ